MRVTLRVVLQVFCHLHKTCLKLGVLAEKEGFEPSVRDYRTHTFQACALNRSAISPHPPLTRRAANYSGTFDRTQPLI